MDQARVVARQAQVVYEDPKSLRGKLYRVARVVVPPLAEKIIPYEITQSEVKEIREQKKSVNRERKAVKGTLEQELTALSRQKALVEAQVQELNHEFLFSSPERALFYALTNLSQDTEARNRFLVQFAQNTNANVGEVQRQYIQLAAKAAPSLHPEAIQMADSASPEQISGTDVSAELQASTYHFEYRPTLSGDSQTENTPKRQVLIDINGYSEALDHLTEAELAEIIRKSGTPLTSDQLKDIMGSLADSENPLGEYQRHPHTVQTGDYKGYHVVKRGRKGRVVFKYVDGALHVRFGDYYKVYADGKKWRG